MGALVGFAMGVIIIVTLYVRDRVLRIGVPFEGVVVAEREQTRRSGRYLRKQTYYWPRIEFAHPKHGRTEATEPRNWLGPRLEIGTKVELRYRPSSNRVVVPEPAWSTRAWAIFTALTLFFFTILGVVITARHSRG